MGKKLNLYLKYFFMTGLMYSILKTLMNLATDREISWYDFLISFLIFGLGMSLAIVSFHIHSVKDLAKRNNRKNFNIDSKQTEEFKSSTPPAELYERLKHIPNFNKVQFHKESNHIDVKTGFSGKSWGDKIDIAYDREGDNFNYKLFSRPRFVFTVLDFGQNLENILRIKRAVNNSAAQ